MYNKKYNDSNPNLIVRDDLFCQYCGKQCKNLNSLKQHEIRCKENPNKIVNTARKGVCNIPLDKRSWAKGLTADTDERVLKSKLGKIEYYKTHNGYWLNKHHTQETKDKISKAQLTVNHSCNSRGLIAKHGYYNGIYFMSTWELAFYIYTKDNFPNCNIERCTKRFKYLFENKEHYYTPDFIVDNNIIEIKGYETKQDLMKYTSVKNIKVLYYNDIEPMIEYVKNKYKIDDLSILYSTA